MSATVRFWVRLTAVIIVAGAIVIFALRLWGDDRSTSDAYISGHVHPIAPRVTGTVTQVLIDDNQHVHKGDVLVVLDRSDFSVVVDQTRAQLAQAQAQVLAANSQILQAKAAISSAQVAVERTRADFGRATALIAAAAISRRDYDSGKAAYEGAVAALEGARGALSTSEAQREAALAQVKSTEANLRNAILALGYTQVTAPIDGYVGRKTVEVGARVSAGQTLLSLVSDDLWVVANYKETQLRKVPIGANVAVTIDALPTLKLHGHVESFSPASGAQFSLLPPDNATGNFTKVVQRIPVKILIEPRDLSRYRAQLMPGLSVITDVVPASHKP